MAVSKTNAILGGRIVIVKPGVLILMFSNISDPKSSVKVIGQVTLCGRRTDDFLVRNPTAPGNIPCGKRPLVTLRSPLL
jgi:hypothetical protein